MKALTLLMFCGLVLLSCSKPKAEPETKTEAPKQEAETEEKEKSKGEADTVEITPEAQQRTGIVVTAAASTPMTQHLQVNGTVQPVDSSIAHIRPPARGRLLEVLVKVGDRVAAGQVLAQLDNIEAGEISAQYNSARAELQRLRIQLAAQQRQVERNRRLAEIGAAPQKDYELSLAEQQGMEESIRAQESTIAGLSARLRRFGISEEGNAPSTTALGAPFGGVIIHMAAAPGDVVESGTELFSLANLSTVYVQAQVYEKDLGQVRVGQTASITVDSYPGDHLTGSVASISDLIDTQTRTAAVRCQVANPNGHLKLDMLATVQFPTSMKRAALSVPSDAVQTIDGKSVVFIRSSPARFSVRQVETGVTSEGRTEIVRGVSDGEPVVSKGAFAVKSVLLGKELGEEKSKPAMVDKLIAWSIRWRLFVVLLALGLVGAGIYAAIGLPIDAVPDVTTNQVQINSVAPAFTPLEMEQYVTSPIEVAMSSLPRKEEIRSISQFGLSQVTIVFPDDADLYAARQLVLERLRDVERDLPPGVAPELAPISTGLGEIYQFTVEDVTGHNRYSLMERRTLLDWFIKPQLRTVPGVIEVNSFGGEEQQYEVLVDPAKLAGYGLSLRQVIDALSQNNINVGGAYLEHGGEQELIRGVGLIQSERDIGNVVLASHQGTPVFVSSVAEVRRGAQIRQGAATRDGKGETVMGIAMMLKGENSRAVTQRVSDRLQQVQKALPVGVRIEPFYNRGTLVDRTIRTASRNLIEGGLVVMAVLFLFLFQIRAGLIVSSAIPLAMLVAIIGMRYFGISANLMSLGAIDFGLVVDAAVIIVENCVRRLAEKRHELGRMLSGKERRTTIRVASVEVRRAGQVGEILIIAAYLPIVSLAGIEGKMFRPMAFTVIFALAGAVALSLTLIPALSALILREPRRTSKAGPQESTFEADNPIVRFTRGLYAPLLRIAMRHRRLTAVCSLLFVVACGALFPYLGAEFLPKLDEGAIAINVNRLPSVALSEAVRMTTSLEQIVREFPETDTVVSRIGRPEIATDPMGPNMGDTYVFLKPPGEWKTASNREELVSKMADRLKALPTQAYSFSQPIEFRMQELIEGIGARSDVVIKIFGDDLGTLREQADRTARIVGKVAGAADVKVQQISGLPMLQLKIDREAIARYGINVADVQLLIQTAIAGTEATRVLEGFRRFGLVVRLMPAVRQTAQDFSSLLVSAPNGQKIPLAQLARISSETGPVEIARENGQRRISVEVNVRGRDVGSFVEQAQAAVTRDLQLPPGYILQWGGLWEHLESGRDRLMIVVPVTFLLIFMLLFATFHSARLAMLVFTGVPFAVTGGILALLVRGMPFSMSAGVGFIAVSGVAVLNGLVLVAFIGQFRKPGEPVETAVYQGTLIRLRPVLMTAAVASLGFLPMALSTSAGSEVQRPLATVVIGGIVTSTFLTLLVLPAIYPWFDRRPE